MQADERPQPSLFEIRRQPDDTTCGPTCLHAVYRWFGDEVPFADLLRQIPTLPEGGTLGVLLANHALARGYRVTVVTWDLQVFDPTWFAPRESGLRDRLLARAETHVGSRLRTSARAYVEFLDAGGRIEFGDLDAALLRRHLNRGIPILTGLSATFLYRQSRERRSDGKPDDVSGDPVGHFVVLSGYSRGTRQVLVSDPIHPNPLSETSTYPVKMERLIGAIYLGVLTYDANLVVIEPARKGQT
jgi:hypothetical protein